MGKRLVALLALAAVGVAGFFAGQMTVDTGYMGSTELTDAVLLEVMDELMMNHFTQPTEEALLEGAIQGIIESLDDPHTTYFDYEEYVQFQSGFGETYVGIGVRVMFTEGLIIVEEVISDGPADEAGIRPNDIIAYVDGVDVRDMEYYEAVSLILGDEGTEVIVGIIRNGYDDPIYMTMTRSVIDNSSVNYMSFTENDVLIGYIEVTTFGDETHQIFLDGIEYLEDLGIEALVIDLRNNGGGHLSTVLNMMREILVDNGKAMFSTEYYVNGVLSTQNYYAVNNAQKPYDIVTLINEYSASASEVFAAGMQEQGGYTLIGTTSYGKGTMQTDNILESTANDRLHISIGRWLTPNGNWVHFNGGSDGITPDIIVEPTVYETAYKMFLFEGDTLVFDSVDSRVANVQLILHTMGYDVREDGYFDQATKDAIMAIQTTNGLTADGIINQTLILILNDALDSYQNDPVNDSQLQAALTYLAEQVTN